MVIGIDATRANHEQKTGVEWYAFHLLEQMKGLKIQNSNVKTDSVRVVLYSDKPLEGELAKLPANWTSKVLHWPPKRLWTQARLSWEMLVRPPDILFIPAHVFPIIHPKKTVMMVHDVAAARFPESYHWFERWYSLFTAKMAARKLWKIIVPSECTKKELLRLLGHSDRIVVIPHGYDMRYKQIEDEVSVQAVLKKYGIRTPFIMSIGRLEEKKNTRGLIEAFNIFHRKSSQSEVRLVLVGRPGHGYEKVKEAIEGSPFKQSITTPGWVSPDDLPYLLNAACAFVFPSLYEGFGLPVLEAMACGTPVVASGGTSLREVAGDAIMYVDPLNIEDIAAGMVRVLSDRAAREENVARGLERVKAFSWDICVQKTLDVLLST